MKSKRIVFAAIVYALLLSPGFVSAHPTQESVADAARKAQASKKTSAKPPVVFTNDNLETITGSVSVVGKSQTPPADQTAAAPDKTKTAANDKAPSTNGETYWRKVFTDARKKLADDAHELDILQREYNLKQQQYYSDPNTAMREQFSRQDLTDTKTKIDDKTAAVTADKQAISDLEDALRQAGGEPGWASQ